MLLTVGSVVLFSGDDVVMLNSLLGDRLVISKTDELIQSHESASAGTSQGWLIVVIIGIHSHLSEAFSFVRLGLQI